MSREHTDLESCVRDERWPRTYRDCWKARDIGGIVQHFWETFDICLIIVCPLMFPEYWYWFVGGGVVSVLASVPLCLSNRRRWDALAAAQAALESEVRG